jgi:general secretion pathway protein I
LSKSSKGFTLLETLMAVVILSTALLLLTNSWSSSYLRVRKTQRQFEVAALLERKMTDVQIEFSGKSLDEIPEEKSEEEISSEYKNYKWKMTSRKLELPDISSTLTAQEGGANTFMITIVKQLTEGLSKAIKEVTVTIIYRGEEGKKPLEYSLTTYFVDYDRDLPMGVPTGQ